MYRYDAIDKEIVADRTAEFREQVDRRLAGEITEDQFKPLRLMNGLICSCTPTCCGRHPYKPPPHQPPHPCLTTSASPPASTPYPPSLGSLIAGKRRCSRNPRPGRRRIPGRWS